MIHTERRGRGIRSYGRAKEENRGLDSMKTRKIGHGPKIYRESTRNAEERRK